MKTLWVTALVGLSLMGAMDSASAQRGGRDDGYDEREYGGRGERGSGSRGRDYDERGPERGRGYDDDRGRERSRRYDDDRGYGDDRGRGRRDREEREPRFDEEEYLRCNPDVRRAVERGEMESGDFHYRTFGRRERRRLTCETRL
jgi:hypothetical protein